ncbi:MAG: hypothetical protein SV760_00065 [Halobacteria archaeon]|nr:hypothetical protein [Halobacteria archaeon]
MDGKEMMFLGNQGSMTREPSYFRSREEAKETYQDAFGEDDEEFEHKQEQGETHRRGYSQRAESHVHTNAEKEDRFGDGDEGWTEKRKKTDLDTLWSLYYQDKKRDNGRRWGVGTDVTGDDRFINDDGEYQETEFWFGSREDAEEAYESYIERTRGFEDETEEDDDGEDLPIGSEVLIAVVGGLVQLVNRAAERVTDYTQDVSFSAISLIVFPAKAVLGLLLSPLLIPLKLFSTLGPKRTFGVIAVTAVGPLSYLLVHFLLPSIVIRYSVLGGMTFLESFIWISLPSLAIATFVQLLYERYGIDLLMGT